MIGGQTAFVALLGCVSVSACGGGGGSVSLQDLGPKAVSSICEFEVRCGLFPDQASCEGANVANLGQITADVNAGKIHYDSVAASDCLNAFASFGCNESDLFNGTPQSCRDAFKGTVADGGACFTGEECVSTKCNIGTCTPATMCCAGTCGATTTPVPKGGDCSALGSTCATGTFCQRGPAGGAATCADLVADGQPCTTFDQCVAGSTCELAAGTTSGVCSRFPAEGEACGQLSVCDASNDFCDAATKTCVRAIAVGGACPSSVGCVKYARCDATTLKCVARSAKGGPCAAQGDCLGSLVCTNGACALSAPPPVCS
jgi:hypothetical protein